LAYIVVHRDPAFVVELSEWDVEGPLLLAEMAQAVGSEMEALADAHARGSEQQQGIGPPVVLGAKLLAEEAVIFWGEGPGEVDVGRGKILRPDEPFRHGVLAAAG